MRLFVAAYPPPAAVAQLAEFAARLHTVRAGARLARHETWHVTLAFLGEVAEPRLPEVAHAVDLAADGALRMWVAGGGTFGRGRSSVLWAGLGGAVPGLMELAGTVRRALGRARLEYDRKPVRPHLTLARPGDRVPAELLAEDVATLSAYQGPEWSVDRMLVVHSQLGPTPTYRAVHTAPLASIDAMVRRRPRRRCGRGRQGSG